MDPFLNQVHGDLRFVRELGEGATAVVYLAEDLRDGCRYAVKVVRPQHAKNERVLDRFRQERAAYEMLRECAHVVPIFREIEAVGLPAFVMEFIDGHSLEDLLAKRGRLPQSEALPLFCQITFAASFAHARGIVHRDIKPSNVLIEKDSGRARLADFGIARIAGGSKRTQYGRALGSMAYSPPEQLLGKVDEIGPASDVYALGATLFEMSLGRLPFADDTGSDFDFIQAVVQGGVPDPRTVDRSYPDALADIIQTCLAKAPGERFANAEELLRAVESAQRSVTVDSARPVITSQAHLSAAYLVDITDPSRPRAVLVGPGGLRIGRDEDNDITVPDMRVSGHHAQILVDAAGGAIIRDLGSTNGTFVEPLPSAIRQQALQDGSIVRIGPSGVRRFVFARRSGA